MCLNLKSDLMNLHTQIKTKKRNDGAIIGFDRLKLFRGKQLDTPARRSFPLFSYIFTRVNQHLVRKLCAGKLLSL